MKPEQRKARTQAGRTHLHDSLLGVRRSTQQLELVLQSGSDAQLMAALELWQRAVAHSQSAASTCTELLDEEVAAWMQEA